MTAYDAIAALAVFAFLGVMGVMPVALVVKGPPFARTAVAWVMAGAGLNAAFSLTMPTFERGFYLAYTTMALAVGLVVLVVAGAIASVRHRNG